MKNPVVLFDLDDTLIHCNKYYQIVIAQFCEFIKTRFDFIDLDQETIAHKQMEIDIAGIHQHGFSKDRFPQSLVDTYLYFAATYRRPPSQIEIETIKKLGQTIFHYTPELFPQVLETLDQLQKMECTLYLYTGGEFNHQMKKISKSGLTSYFQNRIYAVLHKNVDSLEHILHERQLQRHLTWMIGNSMRTDILPAMHVGIHSIYIPAQYEWAYNLAPNEIDPLSISSDMHIQTESIGEVPILIKDRFAQMNA